MHDVLIRTFSAELLQSRLITRQRSQWPNHHLYMYRWKHRRSSSYQYGKPQSQCSETPKAAACSVCGQNDLVVRKSANDSYMYCSCDRCHSHKIKCSGQRPCSGCIAAKSEIECRFRFRDRLIKVPESTLEGLEAEIRDLKAQIISKAPVQAVQEASTRVSPMASLGEADQTVAEPFPNPLLDIQHGLFSGQESSEPVFVGEAACTAFGDRLLQCVSTKHTDVSCNIMPDHITHPVFGRCMNPTFQLPNRIQATLLIRRVQKFIGTNFHLMLRKSFFAQFDRAYNSRQLPDAQWACHLFALLALGELYSNCNSNPADDRIPGMSWFLIAVRLLQDSYEVASLEQVQVLVLLVSPISY